MHVTRLDLHDLRRFRHVEFVPAAGLNLITGANGAGKTSVLEALHLMAYGRSFRGRVRDGLIRDGADALQVFVEWRDAAGRARRAGLRHEGQRWSGRLDGDDVSHLGQLCAALAVVTFEPGSHALISGAAEHRRRYLDWGLFHVEPKFLAVWRRYARALKQRNALLKSGAGLGQLDVWDREVAEAGESLTGHRAAYLDLLAPRAMAKVGAFTEGLRLTGLGFQPGWRRGEMSLGDALLLGRERDRAAGFTGVGPHRADWGLGIDGLPGREALSRGQTKLVALAMLMAQAEDLGVRNAQWPVICLDDLPSELDRDHQQRVLADLETWPAVQVFVTATESPPVLERIGLAHHLFHVEQGVIRAA